MTRRLPSRDPLSGIVLATGRDVSPSGDTGFAGSSASRWVRSQGQPLTVAFVGVACPLPLALQPAHEDVAFDHDGVGYRSMRAGQ